MSQDKGLNRDTIDKYYTKKSVVKECINEIKNYVNILPNDLIIEPSCGNGSFISEIKKLSNNYKFYDIKPEHKEIIEQDFLKLEIISNENIHFIGNPPFGRQSSLAIKFIKKCSLVGSSISFILPKSFKKDSMKRFFPLNFHLVFEKDLGKNSFLVNDNNADVPCVFQIYIKKNELREEKQIMKPINFIFVKKEQEPDISFRRVGVYAGKISKDIKDKSEQSHYFIKFKNNKTIEENIEILKKVKFDTNNTVGPKSISKQEIIPKYNNLI